jgi:hypothetical protein
MPIAANLWNKLIGRELPERSGLRLGVRVIDGQVSSKPYLLSPQRRAEHLVILGKTGTGKTSLIKSMLARDVHDGRGFLAIDLHGDLGPFILGRIREREQRTGEDLGSRTVIINPADTQFSVGLNVLRTHGTLSPLISEVVSIFRRRWMLDRFGARTEELLRNSLWVLAENGLTLLELAPFLTDLGFRAPLVEHTQNAEVKAYFRSRYEQLSDAMQTIVREAILNKASAFTTDPAIRHILGQQAAFDLSEALDKGQWVILQMEKSRLGEDAEVLASLVLARFKNAIFARKARTLFTLYADEVQNLAASSDTLEHLLSEARKFAVSVVTANQHLNQYSPQVRTTLLSAGTTIFFRCSPEDAPFVARALDGGQSMERRLKELPDRHFLVRSGSNKWAEIQAFEVPHNTVPTASLIARSNAHWARPRGAIEAEITARRGVTTNAMTGKETLEGWN